MQACPQVKCSEVRHHQHTGCISSKGLGIKTPYMRSGSLCSAFWLSIWELTQFRFLRYETPCFLPTFCWPGTGTSTKTKTYLAQSDFVIEMALFPSFGAHFLLIWPSHPYFSSRSFHPLLHGTSSIGQVQMVVPSALFAPRHQIHPERTMRALGD